MGARLWVSLGDTGTSRSTSSKSHALITVVLEGQGHRESARIAVELRAYGAQEIGLNLHDLIVSDDRD
jgi:hypothetical protein